MVVDVATLTGACVIALGPSLGLFSADDGVAARLLEASQLPSTVRRMPLDEEYGEALKSNFADMGNVGAARGAITAAMFSRRFTDNTLGHLDIAGTPGSRAPPGATGGGRALTHFVLGHAR